MKEAGGLGLYLKVGGRLHFVLFHKFICGNSWKKGVRHHDFYSELVLRGVGHGCFYFILAGLLPPLAAPHGDLYSGRIHENEHLKSVQLHSRKERTEDERAEIWKG